MTLFQRTTARPNGQSVQLYFPKELGTDRRWALPPDTLCDVFVLPGVGALLLAADTGVNFPLVIRDPRRVEQSDTDLRAGHVVQPTDELPPHPLDF